MDSRNLNIFIDVSHYSLWFSYFFIKCKQWWSLLGTLQQLISLLENFNLSLFNCFLSHKFSRHNFWSKIKQETRTEQFLIIIFFVYLGKIQISIPLKWVSCTLWILRCIKIWICFLKLYSSFPNNTKNQYFYAPSFWLFSLFGLCSGALFTVATLIWYSDTNNCLFYCLLFPFDMFQLW